MFHLAAFYRSVDPAAALTQIYGVNDQAVTVSNNNIIVPTGVPNLVAEAALSAATGPSYAQVQSPSLRQTANQDVLPFVAAVKFGGNPPVQHHFNSPRKLTPNEELSFYVNATGGAAAANYGLVWLASGPMGPINGNIFSVRATAGITLAAGTWVNGALTFDETLPAGTYNVVGMRAEGANLIAARLAFVGGGFRPGVPSVNAVGDRDFLDLRMGANGSFGVFDVNQPPTLDAMGVTDTSQVIVLDLIKVS